MNIILLLSLLLVLFLVIIIILYIRYHNSVIKKKNSKQELNFIWSKGLKNKNEYYMKDTCVDTDEKELEKTINHDDLYIWIRTNDLVNFSKILNKINNNKILISGDNDDSVPTDVNKEAVEKILNCDKIIKWYTQNYDIKNCENYKNIEKIKAYPIGFDFHTNRENFLFALDSSYIYNKLLSVKNKNKKHKIFCDVHLNINSDDRKDVFIKLKNSKNVDFLNKRLSITDIWEKYSEYNFVISAQGNGIDCHRTWEILFLGGIVIVKKSSIDELYKDLPVVIVDDWGECDNEKNLDKWLREHKHKTKKEYLEKFFKYDYWLNR